MRRQISDLYQMQSLSLESKIIMTQHRIRGWYDHYDGDVYVSFSGGKDSTVLLDIVRNTPGVYDVLRRAFMMYPLSLRIPDWNSLRSGSLFAPSMM